MESEIMKGESIQTGRHTDIQTALQHEDAFNLAERFTISLCALYITVLCPSGAVSVASIPIACLMCVFTVSVFVTTLTQI